MAVVKRGKLLRGDLAQYDGRSLIASRTDATGGTITGLAIGNEVDILEVFGSGTSRTAGTIAAAVRHIGTSKATLAFAPGTWSIDVSVTIPSNLTCFFPAGCILSVDSGITLTISGEAISENASSLFTGSGTVVVSTAGAHGAVYHRTAAERSAGVTPTSYQHQPGSYLRYGSVTEAQMATYASDGAYPSASGTYSIAAGGLLRGKFTGDSSITELELRSAAAVGNVFIRLRDSAGVNKAVIGFTAAADETFSITSYEDFRLKFRTGAGDGSTFYNRCHMYGDTDQASWLAVESPRSDNLGGCYVRFVEVDPTVTKGYVGYTSTTDNDLDIINTETDAHIDLTTAGTGKIRLNSAAQMSDGSVSTPSLAFISDSDVGFYLGGTNALRLSTAGTYRAEWGTASHTLRLQLLGQDGSVGAPSVSFENDPDTGIYRVDPNDFGLATAGTVRLRVKANGQVRFHPLSADPSGAEDGDVYYNSNTNKLRVRAASAWVDLH